MICLFSCQDEKEACSKFDHEVYRNDPVDTVLWKEALGFRDTVMEWFNVRPVKERTSTYYHLLYYSSFGFGKSIKIENKNSEYFLSVNHFPEKGNYSNGKNYEIKISKEEWNKFEMMIYEFNFWTESQFKANRDVLDGYCYFLEGHRPEALKCNKKVHQIVFRGSPGYDKIGALCDYICDYEDQLALTYGKREILPLNNPGPELK